MMSPSELDRLGCLGVGVALALTACSGSGSQTEAAAAKPKAPITNRVAIPAAVRQSLGITFAKAESRAVTTTVQLAGTIDSKPAGRRPFHANVEGTLTLHVEPFEKVEVGQLIVSVASPELLEYRHELHLASDAVGVAEDAVRVATALLGEATSALSHTKTRLERIQSAGASKAELAAAVAELEQRVRVLRVKKSAAERALVRAEHRFEAELASFASRVGATVAELRGDVADNGEHGDGVPPWETLTRLELRSPIAGVVSDLPLRSGAWVERGGKVAEVTDPGAMWVVGRALSSDIARLSTGQRVTVAPSGLPGTEATRAVEGTLRVGVTGDDKLLTFPVIVELDELAAWMRPGVAVFAQVAVAGSTEPEIAIPLAALVRDGLETIFFRRDPADADKVIRVVGDLGARDGRWVVVYSGIAPGDEVVIDGAYELKLASTAKSNVIGHFHADGTFHEGEE